MGRSDQDPRVREQELDLKREQVSEERDCSLRAEAQCQGKGDKDRILV